MFEIVLLWLALSVVAGIVAGAKGRNGFGYFVLSLLLSPLIGLILAAALPRLNAPAPVVISPPAPDPRRTRPCPECAEPILREARKCKHCGSSVTPEPWIAPPEPEPAPTRGVLSGHSPVLWRSGTKDAIFLAQVHETQGKNADGAPRSALIRELCREGELVELVRRGGNAGSRLAVVASRDGMFGRKRAQVGELDDALGADLLAHLTAGGGITARVHSVERGVNGAAALTLHIRKDPPSGEPR